jgi:hypothetical protein
MIDREAEIRYLRGLAAKLRYVAEAAEPSAAQTLLALAAEADQFADALETSLAADEDGPQRTLE